MKNFLMSFLIEQQ